MELLREYLVVKVPSIFFNESQFKTAEGKALLQFVLQDPQRFIRNYGLVAAVPDTLPNTPIIHQYIGKPAYFSYFRDEFKKCRDIEMEIKVGDKVYFHYNCLMPQMGTSMFNHQYLYTAHEIIDGHKFLFHYFKVKYELCFAAVRYHAVGAQTQEFSWIMDGRMKKISTSEGQRFVYTDKKQSDHIYRREVTMIGSYTFIEPDVESWEDIQEPMETYKMENGVHVLDSKGMKIKEVTMVQTKVMPKTKYLRGFIRHIGTPLKGDPCDLHVGDYVYIRPSTDTMIYFEGADYWRMRQRNIEAFERAVQKTA